MRENASDTAKSTTPILTSGSANERATVAAALNNARKNSSDTGSITATPTKQPGPSIENALELITKPIQGSELRSPELERSIDVVGLDTMSLLDESTQQLSVRIKDKGASVEEVCMCTDQLAKMIRLKLEIRKASR